MDYKAKISYSAISASGNVNRYRKVACFSDIRYAMKYEQFKRVKYLAIIDKKCNVEEVRYYLEFLDKMFGKNKPYRYVVRARKNSKTDNCGFVRFVLNVEGMGSYIALMYLSAFRYVWEFPEIIKDFYKSCKTSSSLRISQQFNEFLNCHVRYCHLPYKDKKYDNLSGHGLAYDHSWNDVNSKPEHLTFKQFRKNLKNKDLEKDSVQGYFRKTE